MHSAAPADFALLMAAAAHAFAPDRTYTEPEVNERLRAWLAGAGAMLDVDHVELRRWLVDTGALARDGFGRAYARGDGFVALPSDARDPPASDSRHPRSGGTRPRRRPGMRAIPAAPRRVVYSSTQDWTQGPP